MDVPSDDDLIAGAITEMFGERCPDFEPECWCCKVWKRYDHLVSATERAAKIAEEFNTEWPNDAHHIAAAIRSQRYFLTSSQLQDGYVA